MSLAKKLCLETLDAIVERTGLRSEEQTSEVQAPL